MKRALILGGYGGFGARLSRRMAADGWHVLVAGRSLAKAEALAGELDNAAGIAADRNGDLTALLAEHKPDLLMDAAGPFQNGNYSVPQACIAAGVAYVDLADARDFVCGIGVLDNAARRAGVTVISGCSSIPALSGAVVHELAQDMTRISSVDMSISASAQTTAGGSVSAAVLSYAGQPIRLWRGRRWGNFTGWHMLRRETYSVAGRKSLKRFVSLADIPDHDLLPARLPGGPAVTFRAGSDLSLQMLALWLLAWPVRWGWIASLAKWSRLILPLQQAMARLGGPKSAMAVEISGYDGEGAMRRRWTLIAEQAQGAEIPVLAAQLLARRLRDGALEAGARDGGNALSLTDFRTLFADMPFHEAAAQERIVPVYRQALGERWDMLPGAVRNLHDFIGDSGAEGSGTVTRGSSLVAKLAGIVVGFPEAGEHQVHVAFEERGGAELWTRNFSGRTFRSVLTRSGGGVAERFGPMKCHFDLPVDASGLRMVLRRWSVLGIPLPLWLAPRITASESAQGEDFIFDVDIALPLFGPLIHYRGKLRPIA